MPLRYDWPHIVINHHLLICYLLKTILKLVVAPGAQVWLWTWHALVGSIFTRGNEINNIFISSLWCRDKARRWATAVITQYLRNSAVNGQRRVLTLGSLWLPSCLRYTADNKIKMLYPMPLGPYAVFEYRVGRGNLVLTRHYSHMRNCVSSDRSYCSARTHYLEQMGKGSVVMGT